MITIKAVVGVSQVSNTLYLDLHYTEDEWNEMSTVEQNEVIQDAINNNPNQPYWVLDDYE